MGRPRGVKRDTVRLDLSDGDWIDVRCELTVGEERVMNLSGITFRADGTAEINALGSFITAATYITAWSLVSAENGLPIPWLINTNIKQRAEVLSVLDKATMGEIDAAIAAHQAAVVNDPNATGGGTGTGKISSSAAA